MLCCPAFLGLAVPAGRLGATVATGARRAEERVVRENMGKEGTWSGLGKQFEGSF